MEMAFDWDDAKNLQNQEKHGISFEEARELFKSDFSIEYDDENSTLDEDRYLAKGKIPTHGVVIVVYTEFIDGVYRIISARKAEKHEVK